MTKLPSKPKNFWKKFDRIFHRRKKVHDRIQRTSFETELGDHVSLVYVDPRMAIKRLLNNRKITNEATWLKEYDRKGYSGEFSELNSGAWWRRTEEEVRGKYGRHVHILPVILCADGSPTSLKGSVKPAYLSLGNISLKARLRIDSKECLAYIPDNPFHESDDDNSAERRRLINLSCWNFLIGLLEIEKLLEWDFAGKRVFFAIRVMFFLGDFPESQTLSGVMGSWNTSHPCRHCLVPRDRMSRLEETYPPRTEADRDAALSLARENMRLLPEQRLSFHLDLSAGSKELFCFRGRYFQSFPMCVGHVFFSQGLIKKLLTFTIAAIADYGFKTSPNIRSLMSSDELMGSVLKKATTAGKTRLQELDRRVSNMPHFSTRRPDGSLVYLSTFKRGISRLSFITGTHYLHLLQIIPVAIGGSGEFFMPENCRIHILKLFAVLHGIVFLVRSCHVWDPSVISEFERLTREFSELLNDNSFVAMSPSKMQFSKLHSLRHLVEMVREYGSPRNLDTSMYDHAHKDSVKKAYKLSSKQEASVMKQMLVNNERLKAISLLRSQEGQTLQEEVERTSRPRQRFLCHIGTRSINPTCPGIRLDKSALFEMRYHGFGRAGWLTVALNRLEVGAEACEKWYKEMEERKLDLAFYEHAVLPRTDEVIVASARYGMNKERFDVVEIDASETHTYGQVRAIFSAFGSEFVLVRGLYRTFQETFEHPHVHWGYVTFVEDRGNEDGVFWDCWRLDQVKRKVFAAEDFDYVGRFFLNLKAVL